MARTSREVREDPNTIIAEMQRLDEALTTHKFKQYSTNGRQ